MTSTRKKALSIILSITFLLALLPAVSPVARAGNTSADITSRLSSAVSSDGIISNGGGLIKLLPSVYIGDAHTPLADMLPFEDVNEDDWFYDCVLYVCEYELMNGVTDTLFAPDMELSRAMLVTILYRAVNSPEADPMYAAHMMDVEQGSWYEDAMGWAVENGYINGYGEGLYGPNDPVTRAQLVTMLYRFSDNAEPLSEQIEAADLDEVPDWALDAFIWAVTEGIITGRPGGLLDPNGTATRAETAATLQRFL